jgi:flagellar hook protein FlgE
VFTDSTGILASATIASGGVHTGTTTLPATATPATTYTASLNGSDIMIADNSGGTTSASIALVAGTGTETFATQPHTNTYQASVVAGQLQIEDVAGEPLTSAVTAVASTLANPNTAAGAEVFTAGIATNGAPDNRWKVSATIPNSGTTVASIAAGDNIVQFNPDGTLDLTQTTFANPDALSVTWDPTVTGGNSPQSITFNLGSNGLSNGLTELGTTFSVGAINQDGVKFGNFTGVTVDSTGIVTANFNNGLHQAIYIVPIATVPNPDGLAPETGDTYGLTSSAGSMLLNQAGNGNTATITPSSLENSTVDIATEFTNLIITQNAYQANSKLITAANQMLQALLQIQTG